jgi:MATE family multidrug resistance protein
MFLNAAASVGTELGSVELAGFSLGCLVGNLTCLSIMEGSLTAADTLMPRAFGAKQYKEVARLSVRAFCMGCFLLAIPIVPLCFFSSWILKSLGQNSRASDLAQDWIRVYFWGALPNLAFRVLMRFLLAQQKPWPLVFAAGLPALVIHPFLIRTLVPTWDLMGSAWSIVFVQWIAFFLLAAYLWIHPVYHPETWPDLSSPVLVAKALQWEPTWQFLRLAIGGVLSMNEWWFFEIMCFIAGSMGVVSLDAHTVAYNLVPLLFMLALGVSIGLSVRMGHVIANEPRRAKLMAAYCMGFMVMLGAAVGFALHFFRYEVILLFTKDKGTCRVGDRWTGSSQWRRL